MTPPNTQSEGNFCADKLKEILKPQNDSLTKVGS